MPPPADITQQGVCDLTDLCDAFQLIKQLDVNPRGITDLDGAKCRLLRHLSEVAGDEGNRNVKVGVYRNNRHVLKDGIIQPIVNQFSWSKEHIEQENFV